MIVTHDMFRNRTIRPKSACSSLISVGYGLRRTKFFSSTKRASYAQITGPDVHNIDDVFQDHHMLACGNDLGDRIDAGDESDTGIEALKAQRLVDLDRWEVPIVDGTSHLRNADRAQ